ANQHRHPEHHPQHRDQRDDGKERALRLQIPQRQKNAKGQFQIGDTVAANLLLFQTNSWKHGAEPSEESFKRCSILSVVDSLVAPSVTSARGLLNLRA